MDSGHMDWAVFKIEIPTQYLRMSQSYATFTCTFLNWGQGCIDRDNGAKHIVKKTVNSLVNTFLSMKWQSVNRNPPILISYCLINWIIVDEQMQHAVLYQKCLVQLEKWIHLTTGNQNCLGQAYIASRWNIGWFIDPNPLKSTHVESKNG